MMRLFLLLAFLVPGIARADSASTSFLTVIAQDRQIDVAWSLAVRDLDDAVGLDATAQGAITWGALRSAAPRIAAYAQSRLHFAVAGAECPAAAPHLLFDRLGGAGYAVLRYQAVCPLAIDRLDIRYGALFEIDPRHRGLLNLTLNGAQHAAVFSPDRAEAGFGAAAGMLPLARSFFTAGIAHLLGGADHLLFILMLLAPAFLRPAPGARALARLIGIARVLTAFTAAHGIALTLAVLKLVQVPPAIAEPAVALTILLTAADNVVPFLPRRREALALGFGLIHGLSVAGALGPLALPVPLLALALLTFNLGIEAAQLGIAAAAAPLCACLAAARPASRRVLGVLSCAAGLIAVSWLTQRLPTALHVAALLTLPKG